MRPRGEIRQALQMAALVLVERYGGVTWRQLAQHAQVGYEAARGTVKNMVRAGELQVVGQATMPRSRRPMALYAPAGVHAAGAAELSSALGAWSRHAA